MWISGLFIWFACGVVASVITSLAFRSSIFSLNTLVEWIAGPIMLLISLGIVAVKIHKTYLYGRTYGKTFEEIKNSGRPLYVRCGDTGHGHSYGPKHPKRQNEICKD